MAERIGATEAAAICGYTAKTMRKLAAKGIIPGAAQLGNCWRFDERRLREWIRRQEQAPCRGQEPGKTSTGGARSGAPAFRLGGGTSAAAYERLLNPRRGSA